MSIYELNYQKKQTYCKCCERELEQPILSEVSTIEINMDELSDQMFLEYIHNNGDAFHILDSYVLDCIRYYDSDYEDFIEFPKGELQKLNELAENNIKNKIKSLPARQFLMKYLWYEDDDLEGYSEEDCNNELKEMKLI